MSKTIQAVGEFALAIVAFALGAPQLGIALLSLSATTLLAATIKLPAPPAVQVPLKQSFAPRQSAFGEVRVGGIYALFEAVPTSSDASTSYDVLAALDGRSNAFTRYYLHDDRVMLSGAGVLSPDGKKYAYGAGGGADARVFFYTRLGLDTETAISQVVSGVSSIWTSAHRGDGVTSYALICKQSKDKYQQEDFPNGLPLPNVAIQSQLIFDPRDTGQTQGTKSSYVYSDNPALALVAYLTDANGGMGFDYSRRLAPTEMFITDAADDCDTLVDLDGGGTEKRYRCAGVYKHDTAPAEVLGAILSSFDGYLGQRGDGALIIRSGRYEAPTVTFRDKHVVALSVQHFLPDEQVVNEVIPNFTDPDSEFNVVDAGAWRDEADIAARGVVRSQQLDLTWCPSQAQARRLAKRYVARSTQELRGVLTTNLYGLNGLGERYIRLVLENADDPALANVVIEVTKISIDLANLAVTFEWIAAETAIDAWDETTEEEPITDPGDRPTFDPLDAPTITSATPIYDNVTADSAGARISLNVDAPIANDVIWLYRWRKSGDTLWTEGLSSDIDDGAAITLITSLITATGDIEIQVAYRTTGSTSPWSATETVSLDTPSALEESIIASVTMTAPAAVNVYDSGGGVQRVRYADADAGYECTGFIQESVSSGNAAQVRKSGVISGWTGLTIGRVFLSITAGQVTAAGATASGAFWQEVGYATSATTVDINIHHPIRRR